jgi:hypothetical protein
MVIGYDTYHPVRSRRSWAHIAGSLHVHCMNPCTAAIIRWVSAPRPSDDALISAGPVLRRPAAPRLPSRPWLIRTCAALGSRSLLPALRTARPDAPAVSSSSASSSASTCLRPHCPQHRVTTPGLLSAPHGWRLVDWARRFRVGLASCSEDW